MNQRGRGRRDGTPRYAPMVVKINRRARGDNRGCSDGRDGESGRARHAPSCSGIGAHAPPPRAPSWLPMCSQDAMLHTIDSLLGCRVCPMPAAYCMFLLPGLYETVMFLLISRISWQIPDSVSHFERFGQNHPPNAAALIFVL